jgi:hypothetical protein
VVDAAETQAERSNARLDVLRSRSLEAERHISDAPACREKASACEHLLVDGSLVCGKHGVDAQLAAPVKTSGQVDRAIANGNLAPIDDAREFLLRWIAQDVLGGEIAVHDHLS